MKKRKDKKTARGVIDWSWAYEGFGELPKLLRIGDVVRLTLKGENTAYSFFIKNDETGSITELLGHVFDGSHFVYLRLRSSDSGEELAHPVILLDDGRVGCV